MLVLTEQNSFALGPERAKKTRRSAFKGVDLALYKRYKIFSKKSFETVNINKRQTICPSVAAGSAVTAPPKPVVQQLLLSLKPCVWLKIIAYIRGVSRDAVTLLLLPVTGVPVREQRS